MYQFEEELAPQKKQQVQMETQIASLRQSTDKIQLLRGEREEFAVLEREQAELQRLVTESHGAAALARDMEARSSFAVDEVSTMRARGELVKVELVAALLTRVLTKVFGENLLQMLMQSSYFAFTFEQTDFWAKCKILVSIAVGLSSALNKMRGTLARTWHLLGPRTDALLIATSTLVFAVSFATVARLTFAFICEFHVWNISTFSCVAPGASTLIP